MDISILNSEVVGVMDLGLMEARTLCRCAVESARSRLRVSSAGINAKGTGVPR